jgi:hypothetical protein
MELVTPKLSVQPRVAALRDHAALAMEFVVYLTEAAAKHHPKIAPISSPPTPQPELAP